MASEVKKAYNLGVVVGIIIGIGLTIGIQYIISDVRAHTPCNDVYRPPQCEYVQVVNPLTGKLETQYVCN